MQNKFRRTTLDSTLMKQSELNNSPHIPNPSPRKVNSKPHAEERLFDYTHKKASNHSELKHRQIKQDDAPEYLKQKLRSKVTEVQYIETFTDSPKRNIPSHNERANKPQKQAIENPKSKVQPSRYININNGSHEKMSKIRRMPTVRMSMTE
jgi:hypothetical protein